MFKSALAAVFSLLLVSYTMPTALAKNKSASHHISHKTSTKTNKSSAHKKSSKQRIARTRHHFHKAHLRHVARLHAPRGPVILSVGERSGLGRTEDPLDLRSNVALVLDPTSSKVLFEKNPDAVLPIASLTKLMTAVVVVEAKQDMSEVLTVTKDDVDTIKHSSSRLRVGSKLTRANMLHIALMSSENRAASALGRNYPGGLPAFVAAMNAKAHELGMTDTHYVEPTGLSSQNVSSARDLAKLVIEAEKFPVIREYSTNEEYAVHPGRRVLQYRNSNLLVRNPDWDIDVQKTGFINEAGRCMVMQANIDDREVVMVFLDGQGKYSRSTDAKRVRSWLKTAKVPEM
jgi:D-alanyl-D-alanine endopeptidase (penicillin-binding protein 7)